MTIFNKLVAAIGGFLAVISCADTDALVYQRDLARAELLQTQQTYIEQNQELSRILDTLNELAGKTLLLEVDFEGEQDPMSQADQIEEGINRLKRQLDALEAENQSLQSVQGVVRSLRSMLKKQEGEIASLKSKIKLYEDELVAKSNEIMQQQTTIIRANEQIQMLSSEKAENLFSAGYELEKIGDDEDNILNLKGKKNKMNGMSFRIVIYEKALFFYEMAAEEGHIESQKRISVVTDKIERIQ